MRYSRTTLLRARNVVSESWGMTLLLMSAIVLGALAGLVWPAAGGAFGNYVDYTVLLLVTLLFFELKLGTLKNSLSNIRFLSIAWATNFLIVPLIGFIIASLFLSGQPLLFTGLVIYFMAPCTDWFLGFTRLAKGNSALGAILLPINMITQLLLYPLYIHLLADGAVAAEATSLGTTLFQWFFVPFVVATVSHHALRLLLPNAVFEKLLKAAGHAIPFMISILVFEIFASNVLVIAEHITIFSPMVVAIFVFFVATFVVGEIVSRFAKFAYPEHALLTMTTAARNAPMMLGITAIAMPDQPLIYAAIIIGMLVEFPHLTALRQILLASRKKQPPGRSPKACRAKEEPGIRSSREGEVSTLKWTAFAPLSAGFPIAMFMMSKAWSKISLAMTRD